MDDLILTGFMIAVFLLSACVIAILVEIFANHRV